MSADPVRALRELIEVLETDERDYETPFEFDYVLSDACFAAEAALKVCPPGPVFEALTDLLEVGTDVSDDGLDAAREALSVRA